MFRLIENNGLSYYKIASFEETGLVKHCFTTRHGGVSKNEYEALNLRFNTEDDAKNVKKNFQLICDEINVNFENLVFSKQVHDDIIYTVSKKDMGNGIIYPNKLQSADGLICSDTGVPIVIFSADCAGIFFLDKKNKVIALSHSGWKGTVKNIAGKTVEKMKKEYGSHDEDILCAVAPSIGECHFEVGDDVAEIFMSIEGGTVKKYGQKYHVNLQKTIENQLISSGIPQENITVAGICTYCNPDDFYSHRRTGNKRGNMAAIMELCE